MRRLLCALPLLSLGLFIAVTGRAPEAHAGSAGLRVGMGQTFFYDMSGTLVKIAMEPFGKVMQETTGLKGNLVTGGNPFVVAQQLDDNQLQLGVFHGYEFAWVQKKHPELRLLMIALNRDHPARAYVMVSKDSKVTSFADLKGKDLAMAKRTKDCCRQFLDNQCRQSGAGSSKEFFGKIVQPTNLEVALDQVVTGKFPAAVVDAIGLDFYKGLKPGCFDRLRILVESADFPPLVIAYRQGALDDATVERLRTGLHSIDKNETGREMMKTWGITSFEPVPADFGQTLTASLKTYPDHAAKN